MYATGRVVLKVFLVIAGMPEWLLVDGGWLGLATWETACTGGPQAPGKAKRTWHIIGVALPVLPLWLTWRRHVFPQDTFLHFPTLSLTHFRLPLAQSDAVKVLGKSHPAGAVHGLTAGGVCRHVISLERTFHHVRLTKAPHEQVRQ